MRRMSSAALSPPRCSESAADMRSLLPRTPDCCGSFVNGGANGEGVRADAGPRYGLTIAPLVAGGAVGALVSSAPDPRSTGTEGLRFES